MGDFDFMGGESLDDAMDLGAFRDGLGGASGEDGFDDLGGDLGGGLDDLDFDKGGKSKGKSGIKGGKSDTKKGGKKSDKQKGGGKSSSSKTKGGKKAAGDDSSSEEEDLDDLFGYTPKVRISLHTQEGAYAF